MTRTLTWYFDPISPYAYFAFTQLGQLAQQHDVQIDYKPILFGGVLKHWGQLGPAEIMPKRRWTYQQIAWLAHSHGIPFTMPQVHPFNPLPLLRLIIAENTSPQVVARVFAWVWVEGYNPNDEAAFTSLCDEFDLVADDLLSDTVKQTLRQNTQVAIADEVFGVPTARVDGHNFWGFDAMPMLRAYLQGDTWFGQDAFINAEAPTYGIARRAP